MHTGRRTPGSGPGAHHRPPQNSARNERQLDPMMMKNQPALRTSSGLIWVIMGTLFAAACLVPLAFLAFGGDGRSSAVAIATGIAVLVLYAALLIVRVAVRSRVVRLRAMAVCMLSMAGIAVIGLWICLLIEGAPPGG